MSGWHRREGQKGGGILKTYTKFNRNREIVHSHCLRNFLAAIDTREVNIRGLNDAGFAFDCFENLLGKSTLKSAGALRGIISWWFDYYLPESGVGHG